MQARAMLKRMRIADLESRPAGDLPFGQQRLVEISRALVSGAKLPGEARHRRCSKTA